jgi:hypothetical protein
MNTNLRRPLYIAANADAVICGCLISMFNEARMALADLRLFTIPHVRMK